MAKNILIAFDGSDNALRAVEFVGSHLSPDCDVTLFCVMPGTESLYSAQSPELTAYFLEQQSVLCAFENKKRKLLDAALKKARKHLMKCGFDGDRITIQLNEVHKGIARDIIREANKKAYDLVVMGRKGHAGIKEFFLGSISEKVLHGLRSGNLLFVD